MKAEVGDRIVVASGTLHRPIRDGEVLQIGEGGGGPYLVRWSDGNESLFFPGPDAHVEHVQRESEDGADQQAAAEKSRPQATKQWSVDIYLYEDANATAANAVLRSDVPGPLDVRGNATIIDHGWGIFTGYWHQTEQYVKVGDFVSTGQVIGTIGSTGRVTGPHLHWELWVNGVPVDPMQWVRQSFS